MALVALVVAFLPSGAAASSTSATRSVVRIAVYSTADWAQVDVNGFVGGHEVVTSTGSADVQATSAGLVVHNATSGKLAAAVVDVVLELKPGTGHVGIILRRSGGGVAMAGIADDELAPQGMVLATDKATAGTWLEAQRVMGTTNTPWERADDRRLVLAFSYPWFDDWAIDDPQLPVHPVAPMKNTLADATAAATLARQNGIDGFVMSFAGGKAHGIPLAQTLEAARATEGTATVVIETPEAPDAAAVERWIREALKQSSHDSFLRADDGVPVMFVFAMGRFSASTWTGISDRLAASGTPVHLIGDMGAAFDTKLFGNYRYNAVMRSLTEPYSLDELRAEYRTTSGILRSPALTSDREPGLVVATVQPGFDRPMEGEDRVIIDRDVYGDTWDAAISADADWVVVTSWNEWYEATGIAPSVEYGTTALDITRQRAAEFKALPTS